MSAHPWFKFYPNDWLAGTRSLSAVETGVYITIIATLYDRAQPLPNDAEDLARLCGASKRVFSAALARLVATGKLVITENGEIWNARVEEELQNRNEKVEGNSKAARTRWGKKKDTNQSMSDADALQEQCETHAISEVRSQKSEVRESENARAKELKFWDEVQGYLSKPDTLTDWEVDFLHSIKKSETLSKPQADALNAIRGKLETSGLSASEVFVVKRGTAPFDAWIAYKRNLGQRTAYFEKQEAMTVPSLFPPDARAA